MPNQDLRVSPMALLGLAVVMIVGVALRTSHLLVFADLPLFTRPDGDAAIYDALARRLAEGDLMLGEAAMRLSPGYQYFLGLVYALAGPGPWGFRIVQLALGAVTIALVWDMARRLLGARWALLPSGLAACYGPFLFYEAARLATGLAVFTHALLLWLAIRAYQGDSHGAPARARRWLGVGLVWGIACTVRPNALLLGIPLGLALARLPMPTRVIRARALAALFGGCLLSIAPVTARNVLATGELVLLTSTAGFNFYIGNGPGAQGTYRVVPGAQAAGPQDQFRVVREVAEREAGRALSDRQVDGYWLAKTARAVSAAPTAWMGLMARKLQLFWNGRELSNNYDYEFMRVVDPVLRLPLPQFSWLAALALVGTFAMLRAGGAAALVGQVAWTVCLGVVLVFVLARYRLPFVVPGLLAATYGLRTLGVALARRDLRTLAWAMPALALGVIVSVPVPANKHFDNEYFKLAAGYQEQGRPHPAQAAYLRALAHNPGHLHARHNLAVLYERADALTEAEQQWQQLHVAAARAGNQALVRRARQRLARLRRRRQDH